MKKKILFLVLAAFAVMVLSGCELFMLASAIGDYNTVYVKNATGSSITLNYVEDPNTLEEGSEQKSGSVTVKAGATKKKAIVAGDYKLTIGSKQVMPGSGAADYAYDEEYYRLSANTLITIYGNESEGYTYTSESRNSTAE